MAMLRVDAATKAAIRRLDVRWACAHAQAIGRPFFPARSEVTGQMCSAEDVALLALHKLRLHVGNKREARVSRAWLAERGVASIAPDMPLVRVQ